VRYSRLWIGNSKRCAIYEQVSLGKPAKICFAVSN
jgi:hypothetical protein